MTQGKTRRIGVWALVLLAFFFVLMATLSKVFLLTILNGVFLGVVVAVIVTYSPLVWFMFWRGKVDRVSQLSLGIGLLWTGAASQRLYWIVWHACGFPASWQSNYFLSFVSFVLIIGGCLFVSAPGYPPDSDNAEPMEFMGGNRKRLLIFGTVGGIITFVLSLVTGNNI